MNKLSKKIVLISSLLVTLPLIGCNNNTSGGGSTPATPEYDVHDLSTIDSLQKGMYYLATKQNYTMTYSGSVLIEHSLLFTENSIGIVSESYPTQDKIYFDDFGKGIYKIGYNGKAFVASEYLTKSSNLWDNTYAFSLYGVREDYILGLSRNITSLDITDKEYKISFLKTVGYAASDYLEMTGLTVEFNNDKTNPVLTYKMTYRTATFTYTVTNLGTTKNAIVTDFRKNGGHVYAPDATLAKIRRYLQANNFTNRIYQYGETAKSTGYVGTEYFHPHYFTTQYDSSSYMVAYIGLKSKKYSLDGVYASSIQFDSEGNVSDISIASTPYYQSDNVVEYWHYPSYLSLLSSLEYAHEWDKDIISDEMYETQGVTYMVTNQNLLSDFAYNFSLSDSSSAFYGHTPIALGIDYIAANETEGVEETLMFLYEFYLNGYYYTYPICLQNFGKVAIDVLDQVYSVYHD